jgi:uncharacterized membrane protein
MIQTATAKLPTGILKSTRIESIDLLRGVVMIIMALDHVRDYFHADAFHFNPTDLSKTSVLLFFTRWITHFCAPVFVFLAGTSAFLVGNRKGKGELTSFLVKRGFWLIVLEFTIINFSWFFNIHFSLIALTVIWALGIGMIALAGAIHLPFKFILVLGIILVAGHDLLDNIHVPGNGAEAIGWSLLHEFKGFPLPSFFLFVGYPMIPWTGIMLLGYCFGSLYLPSVNSDSRRKTLLYLGFTGIAAFIIIRLINVYGDPAPWSVQENPAFTLLSFINVTKFPPSLLYALVTLGPAMIFLAVSEKYTGKVAQGIVILGRVPMFYYVVHIYAIHIIAVIAALSTGYHLSDMVFNTWITDSPNLKGYGFNLGVVYIVWIGLVAALYPLCKWYDSYKLKNRDQWWLSYM